MACVWAVRHLAHQALGYWITKSNGTAAFDIELQKSFRDSWEEVNVPPGGIIISPTVPLQNGKRNIGHVGIVGPSGKGKDRLIYSNSSKRARWEQNHTLDSWIERYKNKKGLPIRFYPLPLYN